MHSGSKEQSMLLVISTVFSFIAWRSRSIRGKILAAWLPLTAGFLFVLGMCWLNLSIFGSDYSEEELRRWVIRSLGYSILVAQVFIIPWSWISLKLFGWFKTYSEKTDSLFGRISGSIPKQLRLVLNAAIFLVVSWFALLPFGSADWIAKQASPSPKDYFTSHIGLIPPQISEIRGKCFTDRGNQPYGIFKFKYAGRLEDLEIFKDWRSAEQPPNVPIGGGNVAYSKNVLWTDAQNSVKFLFCDWQFQPGFTHWGSFAEYVAGEIDYNMRLSKARAEAVKKALVKNTK